MTPVKLVNALFIQEDTFTLLSPAGLLSGPLTDLRAATTKLKAKGPTTLVLAGELSTVKLPSGLPLNALRPFVQSQYPEQVILLPPLADLQPDLTLALLSKSALERARGAVRGTALKLVHVLTLSDAAQSAAGLRAPLALLHDTGLEYDLTVHGADKAQSRRSKRARGDEAEVIEQLRRVTQPLLIASVTPSVILSGPAAEFAQAVETALKLPTLPLTLEQILVGALQPAEHVALHVLHTPRQLDKPLLGTLAFALLVNGALFGWGAVEGHRTAQLTAQAQQLEPQAVLYRALKAANDTLQTRNDQARQLTGEKGPLAVDLPLIAQRTVLSGGQLTALSGPNAPDADAIRQYGRAVSRTYTLEARTKDAQRLIDGYGRAGLAVHVSEVSCTVADGCQVKANVGPVLPPHPPRPPLPETSGVVTPPTTTSTPVQTPGGTP